MSSEIFKPHAKFAGIYIFSFMENEWFERLVAAVEACEDSKRAISLRAGLSDTYAFHMISKKRPPTVKSFLAICAAINIDPSEILTGVKRDAETGRALQLFGSLPSEQRRAFLDMLASVQPSSTEDTPEPSPAQVD